MRKKVLSTIIGWIIAFVIIFFIAKAFLSHWSQVKTFDWDVNYWFLFACIPFVMLVICWSPYTFFRILRIQGLQTEFKSIFKIVTISSLGVYVPGKIWGVLGLTYFTKKIGLTYKQIATSVFIAQVLDIILNLSYGLIALLFLEQFQRFNWLIILAVPFGFLAIHPRFMNHWLNVILKIFKRSSVTIDYSFIDILKIGCLFILGYMFHGVAFVLFSNSITTLPVEGTLCAFFLFPFARIMGFLSILVPAGVGVQEGIITYVLGSFVPAYLAIIIAFGYRLLVLIVRLCLVFFALKIDLPHSKNNIHPQMGTS